MKLNWTAEHSAENRMTGARLALSLLGLVLAAACSPGEKGEQARSPESTPRAGNPAAAIDSRSPGTVQMAKRLQDFEARAFTDLDRHPHLNERRAALFRERMTREPNPNKKIDLMLPMCSELLHAGRTEDALRGFITVRQQLEQAGAPPTLPLMLQIREFIALCHLRLGEQDNCLNNHGPDSCLMPIEGSGVHVNTRGSTAAIREYTALLADAPGDLKHRWLLNLAYMTLGQYPDQVPEAWRIPPEIFKSEAEAPRFVDIAPALGIADAKLCGGSAMEDFDGDGDLDVMASSWGLADQLRYFRNDGDGSFTDRTEAAGLIGEVGGLNIIHADYDNDGDADLLVLRGAWWGAQGQAPNSLLRNEGDGTFSDVTESAGLLSTFPTQTASWADYDNDGHLDLFIGNERQPSELFHAEGDGTFREVSAEVGIQESGYVKGSSWGDYDNDGLPDLFVSRFGQPNRLFHNDGPTAGGWRFSDVSERAGISQPVRSFPTWWFDYDNDGWLDLLVASFPGFDTCTLPQVVASRLGGDAGLDRVHLYRNLGNGSFENVAPQLGLDEPLLAMGANFGDINNDGYLDCYFGTGEPDMRTLVPNRMFLNEAGQRFADVTTAGGFGHLQKGHGVAFGDLDNDGDQDIYAVMGGAFSGDVYPNVMFLNPGSENRWITLQLRGVRSNRSAIGARIAVTVDGGEGRRTIHATVSTGGSFGSSSLQQEIGLGAATSIESVLVRWPDGGTPQVFRDLPLDSSVRLTEGEPDAEVLSLDPIDLSAALGHGAGHHAH